VEAVKSNTKQTYSNKQLRHFLDDENVKHHNLQDGCSSHLNSHLSCMIAQVDCIIASRQVILLLADMSLALSHLARERVIITS
jgi:hypothetical protein